MGTNTGRFTQSAEQAQRATPQGISRREGMLGICLAVFLGACQAVLFQAQTVEWGGLVLYGTQALLLVGVVLLVSQLRRVRGVHPRGHGRSMLIAGLWLIAVVLVAGWFWIAQGSHDTSPALTTAVAVLSVLPYLVGWTRLVREAA